MSRTISSTTLVHDEQTLRGVVSPENPPVVRQANVLIVDDEAVVRRFLAAVLAPDGHRLFEARDGLEGIVVWRERKPIDLIISDVNMPGLSGPEFAEAILDVANTPVLYVSGLPLAGLAAQHCRMAALHFF